MIGTSINICENPVEQKQKSDLLHYVHTNHVQCIQIGVWDLWVVSLVLIGTTV